MKRQKTVENPIRSTLHIYRLIGWGAGREANIVKIQMDDTIDRATKDLAPPRPYRRKLLRQRFPFRVSTPNGFFLFGRKWKWWKIEPHQSSVQRVQFGAIARPKAIFLSFSFSLLLRKVGQGSGGWNWHSNSGRSATTSGNFRCS